MFQTVASSEQPATSRKQKSPQARASRRGRWWVYIVRCGDGTLYTGVTTDLERRIREHATGKGAKYTRGRGRIRLRYWESCGSKGRALSREAAIKRLSRAAKLRLSRPGA